MAKKKGNAMGAVSDINVTPMVDVMLVLLIIFMVITPLLSKGVPVELASTRNPITMEAADKEDAIVVAVTRDGKTYLGSDPVPVDALPSKVKDLLVNRVDKTVYVKSDARARYERVTEAVDSLRGAGVDQVGLLTEKMKDPRAAAQAAAPAGM